MNFRYTRRQFMATTAASLAVLSLPAGSIAQANSPMRTLASRWMLHCQHMPHLIT